MIERLIHDGFAFDVVDAGPADGEPVILLHGFPERASSWDQATDRRARSVRLLTWRSPAASTRLCDRALGG